MNNLTLINNKSLKIKEYHGYRVATMWNVAHVHGISPKTVRENFENNKGFMQEGKHYFSVEKSDLFAIDLIESGEMSQNQMNAVKDIPVFTEKGYLMIVKPLQGELAWKVQEEMIDNYYKVIDTISSLSPQLQLLINMELEQKKLQAAVKETKQEVQAIREVVEIKPWDNWREDTNKIVRKICYQLKDYQKPKEEIYKALQERGACDLKRRLENMRARLILNGGTRSKAENLNYLDVIAEDKKLIEIYTAIVKEMAIKYKVA